MKSVVLNRWWFRALTGLLILLLAGCAAKTENQALLRAQDAYSTAQSDPDVNQYAPVELTEAKEALTKAQSAWSAGAEETTVEHYSYLARQRAAMAQELADLREAEAVVEEAGAQRAQVLLSAREAEIKSAIERAEMARLQAEEKVRAMEAAQERARQLEVQLAELQAKQTPRGLVLTLGDILFDVNKAQLNPGGLRTVDNLADFLREYPERQVLIEGFTDSTGTEEYNRQLSEKRAESVKNALLNEGIGSDRIRVKGYGESYPIATNDTVAGRQQNRRVEVIISDDAGKITERTN